MTEEQYQRLCRYLAITRLPVTTYFRKLIKEATIHARMSRQKMNPHPAVNHIYSNIRQIARCPRARELAPEQIAQLEFLADQLCEECFLLLPSNSLCKVTGGPVWPRRPRGDRYMAPKRNWALQPNRQERHFYVTGEKIAFNNSVKGDPREERNIPQSGRPLLMKSPKRCPARFGKVAEPSRPETEETKMSEEAKDDVQQVKAGRLQRPMGGLSVWCLCSRSKAAPPRRTS